MIFIFTVGLLFCIHLKNFFLNRTTNERFSKRKVRTRSTNMMSSRSSLVSSSDLDSSGSSMISRTTSVIAEDIIKEMGAPEDYSSRSCSWIYNFKAMCCHRGVINQRAIY